MYTPACTFEATSRTRATGGPPGGSATPPTYVGMSTLGRRRPLLTGCGDDVGGSTTLAGPSRRPTSVGALGRRAGGPYFFLTSAFAGLSTPLASASSR